MMFRNLVQTLNAQLQNKQLDNITWNTKKYAEFEDAIKHWHEYS